MEYNQSSKLPLLYGWPSWSPEDSWHCKLTLEPKECRLVYEYNYAVALTVQHSS